MGVDWVKIYRPHVFLSATPYLLTCSFCASENQTMGSYTATTMVDDNDNDDDGDDRKAGSVFLVVFACTSGCGLHLLARSSLTVKAAARKRQAVAEADGRDSGSVGKAAVPPSSFRALALVGAPR